jgi:murein DD-endopeptidase MepM/ murein hydrolase activator NlpD
MAIFNGDSRYKWTFDTVGGVTRVKISTGEDIAHLGELDPKMWTVLSCPVNGLEIDEKVLKYVDCDGDGKIRVNDVIATAKWLAGALNNPDAIIEGKDSFDIELFNKEDASGLKLYNSSKQILENLGKQGSVITITDAVDTAAIFAKTRFNGDGVVTEFTAEDADEKAVIAAIVASFGGVLDRSGAMGANADLIEKFYAAAAGYIAWRAAEVEAPYGDKTDAVIAAYNALDAKVKDFFVRSRLAAFSPDSLTALDVQTSRVEAISAENLTSKTQEIAEYPIARVTGKSEIDLTAPVNPAWAAQFNTVISAAAPDKNVLTEDDWKAIGSTFAAYTGWKDSKTGAEVEALGLDTLKGFIEKDKKAALLDLVAQDAALAEESSNIESVSKFLYVMKDFYRLLRNFVTLDDFYTKDKDVSAVFQSGRLIIDQRECRFCMKVADMAKHNASAAASGMFLVYCDCTTPLKSDKLTIVAAVTVGDIGDLVVGKNAVYYDNEGVEWDAVITKIIDNPISIAQSFWSPYRRMSKAVENLINKSAADKDAKIMADATAKINAASIPNPAGAPAAPAQPFDIGKFAGIFAAFGIALGSLGTALTKIFDGVLNMPVYKTVLAIIAILLIISGPAMVMAWLKLRRRNIAPLLNANGWAVNASSKISIPFGETLTDIARYPKLKIKDPYARKGLAPWKKWVISLSVAVVVVAGLWLGNLLDWAGFRSPLPRFNPVEVVEETVAQSDSTAVVDTAAVVETPVAE